MPAPHPVIDTFLQLRAVGTSFAYYTEILAHLDGPDATPIETLNEWLRANTSFPTFFVRCPGCQKTMCFESGHQFTSNLNLGNANWFINDDCTKTQYICSQCYGRCVPVNTTIGRTNVRASMGNPILNLFQRHSYDVVNWAPPPRKTAKKTGPVLYMGVELETTVSATNRADAESTTFERAEAIRKLYRIMEGIPFAGLKSDGSLSGSVREGCFLTPFEMVSAPMPLEFHRRVWDPLFDHPDFEIFYATPQCGMHVHIDRAAISKLTLGKMLAFFNTRDNLLFLTAIAGRQFNNFCRQTTDLNKVQDVLHWRGDRYQAMNLTPHRTVEIRMFESTTDKNKFLGRLEFCAALVAFCEDSSMQEMNDAAFRTWLKKRRFLYPLLHKLVYEAI